jgi:hypothetical protein
MAKTKVAATKNTTRRKSTKRNGRPVDMELVRQKVRNVVGNGAVEMVKTSVEDAKRKGNIAAMKYLFEMTGLFPAPPDLAENKPGLAETLLNRLGFGEEEAMNEASAPKS